MAGITFEVWMAAVDAALERISGMTSADLPDYDYRADWTAGVEPSTTAVQVLGELGAFDDDGCDDDA